LPASYALFGDAPGDDLLMTAVFREMRLRGLPRPAVGTHFPELFAGNEDVERALPMSHRFARMMRLLGRPVMRPHYPMPTDHDAERRLPESHLITLMCREAGLTGSITLRPYLALKDRERQVGQRAKRQIAMISTGTNAIGKLGNKQWPVERFQEVARKVRDALGVEIVQVGTRHDPKLEASEIDLRGRTTLREAAGVIAASACYVGNVGFLMHVARAVGTRGVIIFGGREDPALSGYACNENLFTRSLPCAPCWLENRCDHGRVCLNMITADDVVAAVGRALGRESEPLADETAEVPRVGAPERVNA
jgi:hypothetical protein